MMDWCCKPHLSRGLRPNQGHPDLWICPICRAIALRLDVHIVHLEGHPELPQLERAIPCPNIDVDEDDA